MKLVKLTEDRYVNPKFVAGAFLRCGVTGWSVKILTTFNEEVAVVDSLTEDEAQKLLGEITDKLTAAD